jgi:ABC-type maltose transport system permease subunit
VVSPGLTGPNLIASLQLTIGAADEAQGRTAEIFVTAGKRRGIPVFILFALIEGRVVGGLTAGSVK